MSDIRIYNSKNKELLQKIRLDKVKTKAIVEENIAELLGATLVKSNYKIQAPSEEIIETIAIDENFQLVVIEYRQGKFGQTINRGIFHLDYIKRNESEFRILVSDQLGVETSKNVIYSPRLISIGDDFNKYDEYAISQIPYDIELIKVQHFTQGYIALEKTFQGIKSFRELFTYSFSDDEEKNLFLEVSKFVLSLGDEVTEVGYTTFLAYRRIKTFMYLTFAEGIKISLRLRGEFKTYDVNTFGQFNSLKATIESAYDQG